MGGLDDFPLTHNEVMSLRERAGFVTPLEPIPPGDPWCVFESRGTYEFACHPFDAIRYLKFGVVVDGKTLRAHKVEEWPLMGAWLIVAADEDANQQFMPS